MWAYPVRYHGNEPSQTFTFIGSVKYKKFELHYCILSRVRKENGWCQKLEVHALVHYKWITLLRLHLPTPKPANRSHSLPCETPGLDWFRPQFITRRDSSAALRRPKYEQQAHTQAHAVCQGATSRLVPCRWTYVICELAYVIMYSGAHTASCCACPRRVYK